LLPYICYLYLQIVLWGRNEESLKATEEEIQDLGVQATYFKCDVSNREEIYAMVIIYQQRT